MKTPDQTGDRFAFVIPVFNHEEMVTKVIEAALRHGFPIFVVNDGSTDTTPLKLADLNRITVLNHESNQGKGAALKTGFLEAAKVADWAITIDADGQHNPEDTVKLTSALNKGRKGIVIGIREGMEGENVPWTSRFGRHFSNFWVYISGGPLLKDTQSGFRIYPLPEILKLKTAGNRYQYEVEVLVKANWAGIDITEIPVSVSYSPGTKRISHFKPFLDFMRNTLMFSFLICQRILVPLPFRRRMIHNTSQEN